MGGLEDIDWHAPWLGPWRVPGQALARQVLAGHAQTDVLNDALREYENVPVRFIPQAQLPPRVAYEQHIFDTGRVPTRDGLHDFFNALCWMHFPATKRRLNQLQAAQIARLGIAPVRGPARDALTLLDENGALLQAPDALWEALAGKQWQRLFGELRPLWRQAHLVLFGHALLEKLVYPRKPVTAHVYRAHAATNSIANMDAWLALDLNADRLATKPFAHLPVLGVPNWCAANEDPDFYADASVFRAPRLIAATDLHL